MRILTWHVRTATESGAGRGEYFRLDADYRPSSVWIRLESAPAEEQFRVDINYRENITSTPGSILSSILAVPLGQVESLSSLFSNTVGKGGVLLKGSVLSLDVDQGAGGAFTVQLDLREV